MLRLDGITPVMCTPFLEDERIDERGLRRQVDFAITNGAAAICGPGFGSEYYKMDDPERRRFAEIIVDQAKRRIPVVVATSHGSTRTTIEFSRFAEAIKADCVMVTPPRTVGLPVPRVVEYYRRVCDAVSIPVMLQDADFTGAGLPASVFEDLARLHQNFLFAKLEVILPGQKCAEIVKRTEGRVQVIYGLGGIAMMDGLRRGASAFMPGAAAIEVYVKIFNLFRAGARHESEALFARFVPYLTFVTQHLELAVGAEKRILQQRGVFGSARMRQPTLAFDGPTEDEINGIVHYALHVCQECKLGEGEQ